MNDRYPVQVGDYVAHEDFSLWPDSNVAYIGRVLEVRGGTITVDWPAPKGGRDVKTHPASKLWKVRPATPEQIAGEA